MPFARLVLSFLHLGTRRPAAGHTSMLHGRVSTETDRKYTSRRGNEPRRLPATTLSRTMQPGLGQCGLMLKEISPVASRLQCRFSLNFVREI